MFTQNTSNNINIKGDPQPTTTKVFFLKCTLHKNNQNVRHRGR